MSTILTNEVSNRIDTRSVNIIDPESRHQNHSRISFTQNRLTISSTTHIKSYIAFDKLSNEPSDNDYPIIWSNSKGEINIRKPNNPVINLTELVQPLGYSESTLNSPHDTNLSLPESGQGSIQFKKNEFEFGASSQLQYNWGTNTLLAGNIAPSNSNANLNFQIHNTNNDLESVLSLSKAFSNTYGKEFQCNFSNVLIDVEDSPIKSCNYIGFIGSGNTEYKSTINDNACIYTTNSVDGVTFPFNKTGNLIIQPSYKGGCVVFPTTSTETAWKETMIIQDKRVSINPSHGEHKEFIEFVAEDNATRRVNIHGQEGDSGIWSLVHTSNKDLEFQYFEDNVYGDPLQILTMKRITQENVFSYNNRHLCELDFSYDSTLYRNVLLNQTIYIYNSNSQYSFSNQSNYYFEYTPQKYTVHHRNLSFQFNCINHVNSISFYVPNSSHFQSPSNMFYDNSYWIATSYTFSFIMNVNFIDILFDNDYNCKTQNMISFSDENKHTTYFNGFSGFLASATGNFRNTTSQNNINLVNLDDANPVIKKTDTFQDPSVIGVIGRIEKEDNDSISRPLYWGAFGTTLYDRDTPRVLVTSSGFVGAWVVVRHGNTNDEYTYLPGDLLTSHSCGALIQQTGTNSRSIFSYTIAKICIDSVINGGIYDTENTSQYTTTDNYILELKGVMLLL